MKYLDIKILPLPFHVKILDIERSCTMSAMDRDTVDLLLAQWRKELPDLHQAPMAVVARISRAEKTIRPRLEEVFESFGLTGEAFDVLATLRRSGPPYELSPTDLFKSLLLSSAAMTSRIDRLEEAGLVARSPHPEDRRGIRVALTAKGKELIERALDAHVKNEEEILAALNATERKQLAGLLRKLLVGLERTD
jgi:DNA-binding MarR family transcriptional regulator